LVSIKLSLQGGYCRVCEREVSPIGSLRCLPIQPDSGASIGVRGRYVEVSLRYVDISPLEAEQLALPHSRAGQDGGHIGHLGITVTHELKDGRYVLTDWGEWILAS